MSKFAKYTWSVLFYNLAVILWGAYVRATSSGAGCGSHWPSCNGEVIPRPETVATLIEFTHRVTSGLAFLLVAGMLVWAMRTYERQNPVRRAASWAMLFMLSESLVGAGLVLFEWVAGNISVARVIVMGIHLLNTHLLLASITLTTWWASGKSSPARGTKIPLALLIGLLATLLLSMAGAVTALGDTIFPAESLAAGIQQDLDPTSHFLIRLRVLHPVIAILVGVYLAFVAGKIVRTAPQGSAARRAAWALLALFGAQLTAGLVNLLLLVPVWMQLIHLLLADLVWIALILLTNEQMLQQREA